MARAEVFGGHQMDLWDLRRRWVADGGAHAVSRPPNMISSDWRGTYSHRCRLRPHRQSPLGEHKCPTVRRLRSRTPMNTGVDAEMITWTKV